MIRRRSGGTLATALLIAACAGLGWTVYRGLATPQQPAVEVGSPANDGVLSLPPATRFEIAPLEDFIEVAERPLFSPSRRPPLGEVATATPRQALDLTLIGVVLSSEERLAIVTPGGQGKAVRLGVGDSIQGWTLVELESERATFERDGESITLYLAFEALPTAPRRQQGQRDDAARQGD